MGKKEIVYKFLNSQKHAVISTINSEGRPESALIGFGQTKDLELVFGTETTTRKYKNIKNNTCASFVIGGWTEFITVQYEGCVVELSSLELEELKSKYHQKNPAAKKYEKLADQKYFKVTPKWIRYSDFNNEPEEVFELRF